MRPSCIPGHGADLGFGDQFSRNLGLAAEPPHGPALGNLGHVIFDGVARNHGLAKLRLVDRHEIDELRFAGEVFCEDADRARGLRHAFDEENAGEYRIARKVSLKLRLVGGDVLDADGGLITADVDDPIHQQERITVG